ncbi:hypothetical protein C5S36_06755 [Candidatus Methanophagaceae archaeon]|nr:hypothetical protein C5S36_06755 [Methanophagales archaeon]
MLESPYYLLPIFPLKRLSNNSKLGEKERQIILQIKKEGIFLVPKPIVGQSVKASQFHYFSIFI